MVVIRTFDSAAPALHGNRSQQRRWPVCRFSRKAKPRGTLALAGGCRRPLFTQDAEPHDIDALTSLDCTFAQRALVGKAQPTWELRDGRVVSRESRGVMGSAVEAANRSKAQQISVGYRSASALSYKPQ